MIVVKGNLNNLVIEIGLKYKELNRNEYVIFNIEVEFMKKIVYFDVEIIIIIFNNLLFNVIKYILVG